MPRMSDYNITEDDIRSYVLQNNKDALSHEQLRAIAYDYLQKVIRRSDNPPKWPKDVKDLCYSKGIRQDKETGLPVLDENGTMAWSERAKAAEEQLIIAHCIIQELTEDIEKLQPKH